jgi:co-chaperonin GroES (HSP10)
MPSKQTTASSVVPLNTSGLQPVEYKVLVLPEEVPDKIGSIILTDETKDTKAMAQGRGKLIAIGSLAFEDWNDSIAIGDEVIFPKYAGFVVPKEDSADGRVYRLFNDKEVVAVRRV